MTTDFTVTFFATIFLLEWVRYLKEGKLLTLITCAILLGLACVTKFSALILIVFPFVSFAYCRLTKQGFCKDMTISRFFRTLVIQLALIGTISIFIVNAFYFFQDTGLRRSQLFSQQEPQNPVTKSYNGYLMEKLSPVRHIGDWAPIPLPYSYLYGITSIRAHNLKGHSSYFFGNRTYGGTPAYFPTLFILKNSLAIPILLLLGLILMIRFRRRFTSLAIETQTVILYASFFLAFCLGANLNLGVRHILPIFPAAIIVAALVLNHIRMHGPMLLKVIAGILCVETAVTAAVIYPNHLGFFNLLAGGPKFGSYVSIVGEDWGQNIEQVAHYFSDHKIDNPYSVMYGLIAEHEFHRHGVSPHPITCDSSVPEGAYVSIPRTIEWRAGDHCYQWLAESRRVALINNHVTIYRVGDVE